MKRYNNGKEILKNLEINKEAIKAVIRGADEKLILYTESFKCGKDGN